MFFKLSLRNAKRSFKDYMIYFLTLTFGVCIFYMFNALDAQQAMLEITTSKLEIIKNLSQLMGIISIFVAFILGFLMIYANHFLIRRRKKELGLYLTLGMNRHTVNFLLVIESLIIAIFALISGLVLGTFLSHGLSIVTAQLFAVDLKSFTFIFSTSAACKSIVFFAILFAIVIIFNTISIAKYKLIDLLQGEKKNETLKMLNFPLACFFFILSLVILVIAYTLASINGLRSFDTSLLSAILLGCIGTYLFFYSIAGIASKLCIKYKTFYYKNINLFIVNQVMSKIKTHHISMSVICLMLFFTIGVLSTGLSMSKTLTSTLEATTPYDATLYVWGEEDQESLIKQLESYNFPLNDVAKEYLEFNLYQAPIHYSDLFNQEIMATYSHLYNFNEDLNLTAIKLSDFNKVLELQGATPITLNTNEYAISSNVDTYINLCKEPLGLQKKLTIGGQDLSPKYRDPLSYSLESSYFTSNQLTLVLNDELLVNAPVSSMYLNINFFNNQEECEALFTQSLEDIGHHNPGFFIPYTTKISTYETSLGLSTIVTYIGIYIGFVFLIASAAILALQQLLEITDHTAHYEILRKLGVPYDTLKRSLFTQIALYFFAPLSLALVHSIVGLNITNNLIAQFGSLSLGVTTFITAFFLVVIYGGYFLTTYITAKNVILNNGYVR
ncbi:ABC transporter permease [Niameybacter massiliensis]|uniref:ABC transporter permease n=1 Tax=Niameybacter massiliensis TaxID=1658108 RepID=UPI0006B5FDAC|nr:ABC transporter permease [Niameybacter massiliensis]